MNIISSGGRNIAIEVPGTRMEMGKGQYYQHAFVTGGLGTILGKLRRLIGGLMENLSTDSGINNAGVGNNPVVAFKDLQVAASQGSPSSIVFTLNQKFPVGHWQVLVATLREILAQKVQSAKENL
jgi:hypothetical protein